MMVKIKGSDKHWEEMGDEGITERISDEELKNTLLHIERSRCLGERDCNISLYDLAGIIQEIMECRENQPKYEKTIADMAEWIEGTAEVGEYCDGCQYFDNENESCSCMMADECRAHIMHYYMTNNHIGE